MAHRPRLGQHFLHSSSALARIARELGEQARDADLVIEIGAGLGALTGRLLTAVPARVLALEVDPRLAAALRRHDRDGRLEVLEADVLALDLAQLIGERTRRPAVIAGNLPYYITSPILNRILEAGAQVSAAVLLVQREVASRIVARPGTRDFGYLSVLCQAHGWPEALLTLPPSVFRPAPKVASTLVRLRIDPLYRQWGVTDRERFLDFARLCFQHKRKTLLNNLAPRFGRSRVETLPEAGLRAEQLSAERLAGLWTRLQSLPQR